MERISNDVQSRRKVSELPLNTLLKQMVRFYVGINGYVHVFVFNNIQKVYRKRTNVKNYFLLL